MLEKTLPGTEDVSTSVANKIAQSLTNAFKITKAFEKAGLSSSILNKMNQEELDSIDVETMVESFALNSNEKEELETKIQSILATPAVKSRDLIDAGATSGLSTKEQEELKQIELQLKALEG